MAYTGTIVTEAEMQFFAGSGVDANADTEANHNLLAGYAEAYLSSLLKYDIVSNWGSLNTTYRKLLSEWAARFAAIGMISYNINSYTDRIEAEDMINIHYARMQEIIKILSREDIQDFLNI